jgi:hypothetical protein
MIPDFTTVTGVDAKHLRQLAMVWPTWKRHKHSTIGVNPMVIFYEREQVRPEQVRAICDHPRLTVCPWPPEGVEFSGDDASKWTNRQRHKMLAGFVYVPAIAVETPYWLKLDTDAVATGQEDWIDPTWFEGNPAIVSHPWGFTRPPNQMLQLDDWVGKHYERMPLFHGTQPLKLAPKPGEDRLNHKRIGSWCAFFRSDFNRACAKAAQDSLGPCQLPVASQDGFTFYCATRLGEKVVRPSMKRHGWTCFSTEGNIARVVQKSMKENDDGSTYAP